MPSPAGGSDVVVLDGVGKRFRDRLVLDDLSFTIAAGEFVALVGPSGCGKSTTLRILAGLEPSSAGTVHAHGSEVRGPIREAAMVFQAPVLLPWRRTVDNILLTAEMAGAPADAAIGRAHELVRLAGLEGFERSFPHELSGGMQQRVSICRALLLDPALLLMDEPFGALDVLTREKMGFELERIWEATRNTVLFVTHSINEAILLSDRVLVMSARPGTVKAEIRVGLARPRTVETLGDPAFVELAAAVRKEIEDPV